MPSLPKHRCTGTPNCPVLLPAGVRYCAAHEHAYEARRGTTAQRGYGSPHQRMRAQYEKRLKNDEIIYCCRCGHRVHAGTAWDLDHTDDRRSYRGIACAECNRRAGGRLGAAARR